MWSLYLSFWKTRLRNDYGGVLPPSRPQPAARSNTIFRPSIQSMLTLTMREGLLEKYAVMV